MSLRGFSKAWVLALLTISACVDADRSSDREAVLAILADLDRQDLTPTEHLRNYLPDAVILPPGSGEVRGHDAIRQHLSEAQAGAAIEMIHQIVEMESSAYLVVVQGKVVGTAKPACDPNTYPFETKNIILFKRADDGALKIWKVIYNAAPTEPI